MGQILKLKTEIAKLQESLKHTKTELAKADKLVLLKNSVPELEKSILKAKQKSEDAEGKWKEIKKGKDDKATAKAEQEKNSAKSLWEGLGAKRVEVLKDIKSIEGNHGKLVAEVQKLEQSIASKEGELRIAYQAALKAYGDKKNGLIKAYKDAEPLFSKWSEDAKQTAKAAEMLADGVRREPDQAKAYLAKGPRIVELINACLHHAQEKQAELMALFDPHRTGEKPEEYELEPAEGKAFSTVFPMADAFRKKHTTIVGEIEALKQQIETTLKMADISSMDASAQLSEFSKVAQEVKKTIEDLYGEMEGKLALQGVVGKDLAGQMTGWKTALATATPDAKAGLIERIAPVARNRMLQVVMNEKLMVTSIASIKSAYEKGFGRIPEKHRKGSPLIKAVEAGAREVLVKADTYASEWAKERQKGEAVYNEITQLVQAAKTATV